jgi:hypothetical protein
MIMDNYRKSNDAGTVKGMNKSSGCLERVLQKIFCFAQPFIFKYTMEEYLEVMSEFTDSLIREGENNGLTYIGGRVSFTASKQDSSINACVKMYFKDDDNKWLVKKAERRLEKNKFTSETVTRLESEGELEFEIN